MWLALLPFWNGELACQASYSWQFSIGLCCKDSPPTPLSGSLPPSQQRTVLNLPFWDSTLLIYISLFQTLLSFLSSPSFLLKITPFCCRKSVKSGKEKREKLRREKTEKGKQKQESRSVCKAFSCYEVMPLVAPNLIAAWRRGPVSINFRQATWPWNSNILAKMARNNSKTGETVTVTEKSANKMV